MQLMYKAKLLSVLTGGPFLRILAERSQPPNRAHALHHLEGMGMQVKNEVPLSMCYTEDLTGPEHLQYLEWSLK